VFKINDTYISKVLSSKKQHAFTIIKDPVKHLAPGDLITFDYLIFILYTVRSLG